MLFWSALYQRCMQIRAAHSSSSVMFDSQVVFSSVAIMRCHVPPSITRTGNVTIYCCYGYCVDLLRHLANRTKSELSSTVFTFDLHLIGDGQIGEEVEKNDTRQWTGIIGEILSGMADLAVAPVSITPERAARVEFSKPFKYLGITILVKRVSSTWLANL